MEGWVSAQRAYYSPRLNEKKLQKKEQKRRKRIKEEIHVVEVIELSSNVY